jgi:hypothetical protein
MLLIYNDLIYHNENFIRKYLCMKHVTELLNFHLIFLTFL